MFGTFAATPQSSVVKKWKRLIRRGLAEIKAMADAAPLDPQLPQAVDQPRENAGELRIGGLELGQAARQGRLQAASGIGALAAAERGTDFRGGVGQLLAG